MIDRLRLAAAPAALLAFALHASLLPRPLAADLAVVPTDYATVQAAIDAVEGTPDARVRIDSDALFEEFLNVADSISIEGGAGFSPTVRALEARFDVAGARSLTLRNLRLRLAGPMDNVNAFDMSNDAAQLTLLLDGVTADATADPERAGGRVNTGSLAFTWITIRDSHFRARSGDEFPGVGFYVEDNAELSVSGSVFEVEGTDDLAAIGLQVDAERIVVETSHFFAINAVGADLEGDGDEIEILLSRNETVAAGEEPNAAWRIEVENDGSVTATDNVVRGARTAFRLAESEDVTVHHHLLNNTIVGSLEDAIAVSSRGDATVEFDIHNNLIVGSGGWGIAAQGDGTLTVRASHNGFFANLSGNVQPQLATSDDVDADPRFLGPGDLRLRTASPMLDAGWNGALGISAVDHLGAARIQNGTVDLGAYEGAVAALVEVPTLDAAGIASFAAALIVAAGWTLRRRLRSVSLALALLAAGSLLDRSATAATAVVPTDYATIQEAVDAVQGTPDALVRIDSNDTFAGSVGISDSVLIAAGAGYRPTIQGDDACSYDGLSTHCTVGIAIDSASPVQVEFRGLRILAGDLAPAEHVVQVETVGSGILTVMLSHVAIDNRETGARGVVARTEPGGLFVVDLFDSTMDLGAPSGIAEGFALDGPGVVNLGRSTVRMTAEQNNAIRGTAVDAIVFDSTIDLRAAPGPSSHHLWIRAGTVRVERSTFHTVTEAGGFAIAVFHDGGELEPSRLLSNTFTHQGDGEARGVDVYALRDEEIRVEATNNLAIGMTNAFFFEAESGDAQGGVFGGSVQAGLLNNTIVNSIDNAVSVDAQNLTEFDVALFNNLITGSGGWAFAARQEGGAVEFLGIVNGFFGNGSGNVQAPFVSQADVLADPRYVSATDFHIRRDSPMRDAGLGEAQLPQFDHDGMPRVLGTAVDIGAYEVLVSVVEVPALDRLGAGLFAALLIGAAWMSSRRRAALRR
jgi:hypothetical protein